MPQKTSIPRVREDILRSIATNDAVYTSALQTLREHHTRQDCGSFASEPSEGVRRARIAAAHSVLPEDRHSVAVELTIEEYYQVLDKA